MVSSYIWVDSRLKGLSIEFKNTQKGLRTKKLWPSEVGGHNQKIRFAEPAGAYCFLSFSDIIWVQVALSYIWVDSRLKGLSIESKNTQNGLWTKKLWLSEAVGHNQKICSKEQCHPACYTPCVLLHFGLISEPKGFGIWIYLFQGDMFSYESSLPKFESLNSDE